MRKITNNKIKGGAEELDKYLSTKITEEDLEQNIDLFAEAIQSACRRTFQNTTTREKTSKKKSVPWWTDNLTLMRKKVNACKRLFQRTRNDGVLRENRKKKYLEAKRTYQAEIEKKKVNSWKEFCNVAASINPWTQVYKLAAGKKRANSIMTTLRKPDGSETMSLQDTVKVMLVYLSAEGREETLHHKNIRKYIEEPLNTRDDIAFSREEIKETIDSFNQKKAQGIDGITGGTYQRTYNIFPRVINAIYNQCLKKGRFPKRWETAKIIPTIKPGKEKSMDPSKYRPISLLNMGGKILEKLLINRINHRMYKNELVNDRQFVFTPQKSTTNAAMGAKQFMEPLLEKRSLVRMTSLDVKGAYDHVWWPGILKGLKYLRCPRNLYKLSKGYFSNRTAVMNSNSINIQRSVTKGYPQGSCCRPGYWNVL
jgi:hypothetical protein